MSRAQRDRFPFGIPTGWFQVAYSSELEVGQVMAEVRLDDGYLSEMLAPGFTLVCFDADLADAVKAAATDESLNVLVQPADGAATAQYGAAQHTAYLIRPDRHVAARWLAAKPEDIRAAYKKAVYGKG